MTDYYWSDNYDYTILGNTKGCPFVAQVDPVAKTIIVFMGIKHPRDILQAHPECFEFSTSGEIKTLLDALTP